SGSGLAEQLTPDFFPGVDRFEEAVTLLRGAEGSDGGGRHAQADHEAFPVDGDETEAFELRVDDVLQRAGSAERARAFGEVPPGKAAVDPGGEELGVVGGRGAVFRDACGDAGA